MSELLAPSKPGELTRELTPMGMIEIAISQNADIDKLTKLMELQERWEANQARKAFNVAFSEFKSEAVTIIKNNTVKDGPLKDKKYADLFGVVNVVTPVMSKHGLTHSWKLTKDEPTWMEVTCTIKHILGHSESVSMGAAPDTGPGRNAIQARGSAKSYLERYTLLAATGMAASDADNDGNGGGNTGKTMDSEEFDRFSGLIEGAGSLESLKQIYLAACKDAKELDDQKSIRKFAEIKNKRYKELA